MKTRALIHAAGKGERWDGEGEKQLLKVYDETIIGRLIRCVHFLGHKPTIVTNSEDIIWEAGRFYPVDILRPKIHGWHIETLLSSQDIWDERTVVLFGDTLYASARLVHILSVVTVPHYFWGNYSQLFAMSFTDKKAIKGGIEELLRMQNVPGRLLDLYRYLEGLELGQTELGKNYSMVEDPWTMDIDSMDEYEEVLKKTYGGKYGRDQWM